LPTTACKKKLYALNPAQPPQFLTVQRTRRKERSAPSDPKSLERQVRQLLADKISGNQVGIWLLVPEHLRLGTWDLLLRWTGQPAERVEPRMALHLVHEAALCLCSFRQGRTLSQKGFELANGLPFVPTDQAMHDLLDAHTVEQAQHLQIALGKLRRASQHFTGPVLAMDPHRMTSHTKRLMRRHRFSAQEKPTKMGQTFFLLDTQTGQPICFTLASSAPSVVQASPDLLRMAAEILSLPSEPAAKPLVLADKEHFSQQLFTFVREQGCFDLLCPVPAFPYSLKRWGQIPAQDFTPQWPGYATTTQPYRFEDDPTGLCYEMVQRNGGTRKDFLFQGFVSTVARPEMPTLTRDYPRRWHVEEFFKFNQALGWHRTGTLNLNVRYGQMSMALLAQAAIHQFRGRMGQPMIQWEAEHLAQHVFQGLEGDVRVRKDTIIVTFYNAPNANLLRAHYENLPEKLQREGVDPHIPWLYNFKLNFRFK
jgi:hypothetical protein